MWTRPVVVGVALALVSGGCAIVPTSGSPRAAEEDNSRDTLSQPYVRMIAEPPKSDASPSDIVRGFQSAMASFEDSSLKIARLYLTPDSAQKWNPWEETRIYEGKVSEKAAPDPKDRDATVTLKGNAVATIDPEGRYTPTSGEVVQTFTLIKVDTRWRILSPPNARLLSADDLKRAYRQIDLYYPLATRATGLVADRVWVPIDPSSGVPETRVRRLLGGPTRSIRDAASSAFPSSTELNQITVEGDTVVVDFSPAVESVSSDRIDAMEAQLAWTLRDLVTGRTIEIRVNGEPFRGSGLRFKPTDYSQFDPNVLPAKPQAYYMQGGKLHRVKDNGGGDLVAGAAGEQSTKFSYPAVSGEFPARVAALVNGNGVYVADMAGGSQWQRWIAGKSLTPPSWDRYGYVWSAERADNETRVWQAAGGQARRVIIPADLATGRVISLRVSRDGARIAMKTDSGLGAEVKIGTVVRVGQQARIDNVQTLVGPDSGQDIVDIAWQNAAELLVLSKGKGGQQLAKWSVMEGMAASDTVIRLDPQTKIDSIVGAPDHVLADGDGEVRTYSVEKRAWTALEKDGATTPVYPLG
ncbi:hypothetical protein ABH927_004356 [Planotetraspora sp. GP83]